jgi:antitoxin StbD
MSMGMELKRDGLKSMSENLEHTLSAKNHRQHTAQEEHGLYAERLEADTLWSAIFSTSKSTLRNEFMTHIVLSQVVASISELKKNPMGTVAAGGGLPVAILNRNEPAFYCVPAKEYEALMNRLEDLELIALCKERENDPTIKVSIDDL